LHCTAGIMSNGPYLESYCSWRTRLLDLLWVDKPVVTSGFDPLSAKMAEHESGICLSGANALDFASKLNHFSEQRHFSGKKLASTLSWSKVLENWRTNLNADWEIRRGHPSLLYWIEYFLGI